ncbi:hypothetical protein CPB85DRAFT_1431876 [Mucidula mucida]|nr:hypothetical protein CPB85DRAFT_1431876 [Mucidula mucida]
MPPKEPYAKQFFGFVLHPYTLREPGYPSPESFLHFPDTHLDENLILKRICVLPSLLKDILHAVDTMFPFQTQIAFKDATYNFSRMPYPKRNDNYRVDNVRKPYATGIASASLQLVSGILIHPDDPYKARIVGWRPNPYPHTNYNTPFHDEDFILKMMDFAEKDLAEFSTSSQERFPAFTLGILLCPNGEWCLEQMDELSTSLGSSIRTLRDTHRYPALYVPRMLKIGCGTYPTSLPQRHPHSHFKPKDFRPAPPRDSPGARELLQRAWYKAVRLDVSVILFDCGNLLRIGIRHRQTQTLYLTPIRTHQYFKTHPVLAIYLYFGDYNSPTPEVLLSPDQPRSDIYKAKTCLPLLLTAKLGQGATGRAYTAILERATIIDHAADWWLKWRPLKIALCPCATNTIYQDDVRGIGALVMNDVGKPLGRRMDSDKKIKFSGAEKSSLEKILKDIHSAGVLHRDLRSWNVR